MVLGNKDPATSNWVGVYLAPFWFASNLPVALLLFPVDRDTHEFLGRLQSNVFNAASLFQTTHVVHWSASREAIFSV